MVVIARSAVLATLAICASCASRNAGVTVIPAVPLAGEEVSAIDARALAAQAAFTVFVFFAPDCHCLDEHEPRLRALDQAYRPRGVQIVMIDSAVRATVEGDAAEARRRAYPFPILTDRGARLADALGAEYATYSVVVDRSGRVRYSGGIDSDKNHLHDDAVAYLKNALDDLIAGRAPRVVSAKALGCALEKW